MSLKSRLTGIRPPVLLDCTGECLSIYSESSQRDLETKSIPFDITLKRSHLGPEEVRRAFRKAGTGLGRNELLLSGFNRYMELLAGDEEVSILIWRRFFQTNRATLSSFVWRRQIVVLVPTTWEPQGSRAFVRAFGDVFSGVTPNVCVEAIPLLFGELWERHYEISTWPSGEIKQFEIHCPNKSGTAAVPTYEFELEKEQDRVLAVRLTGWWIEKKPVKKSESKPKDAYCPSNEPSITSRGYNGLVKYLEQKNLPRVDLSMQVDIGIAINKTEFLPLMEATDSACRWFGRSLLLKKPGAVIDVPLAARIAKRGYLFPLSRLVLTGNTWKEGAGPVEVDVWLRRKHYGKADARMVATQKGTSRKLIKEILLPRLYR